MMAFASVPAISPHRNSFGRGAFICSTTSLKPTCRKMSSISMNSPTPERKEEEVLLPPEDKAAAEKLAEQARLRAAEKFMEVDEGNHVCINCGYLYEPAKGERISGIPPGTDFLDLDELFACPVCKSPKSKFRKKPKTIAGFSTNQSYGLGVNSMTSGQKNLLIFGGMAFFILLLLGGYLLD